MKLCKVGIFLYNAYAYVLFGVPNGSMGVWSLGFA